jgi:histidyl-tRNA synthetase
MLGSEHPAVDAEMIEMALQMIGGLGIQANLMINSVGCKNCRPQYIELLKSELQKALPQLCEDCRRRSVSNSLRVFDCKVESCQPFIGRLPVIADHLCPECSDHFSKVKSYLNEAKIDYRILPRLVRGLDYYVRTAFEIVSGDLGSQNALAGGGRYDGLSEILGGPPAPAIGFAMGLDRLVMVLPEEKSAQWQWRPKLFLAYMGEPAFKKALDIARELRGRGYSCLVDYAAGSLKSQFRLANKIKAEHILIIGDNELARGSYSIKDLDNSRQWEVTLPDLIDYFQAQNLSTKS